MTNTDSVIALRHTLHAHAERSNQETKTRAIIKDFLKTQTDTRIEDRGSWLYAVHEEEGAKETLVFRADHDAIVNSHGTVYHGCGHDGHTAMLAGCAQALSGQRLGKNIVYLFQPAEENGTGAALCTPLFSEYRVDAVYGLHNMPGVEKNLLLARPGTMQYASEGLTLDFLGKQSHASQPENGINPAFAVAKLMLALQPFHKKQAQPLTLGDLTFSGPVYATIVHARIGNENFGISPGEGTLSCTIRAEKDTDLTKLAEGFLQLAHDTAGPLRIQTKTTDAFPETRNDPALYEKTTQILKEAGLLVQTMQEPLRGSEDFGVYKDFAPTFFCFLGAGKDYPPLHTDEYEFPDEIAETGIRFFTTIARA